MADAPETTSRKAPTCLIREKPFAHYPRHRLLPGKVLPKYISKRLERTRDNWDLDRKYAPENVYVGDLLMLNNCEDLPPFHTEHVFGDVYFKVLGESINPATGMLAFFTIKRIT